MQLMRSSSVAGVGWLLDTQKGLLQRDGEGMMNTRAKLPSRTDKKELSEGKFLCKWNRCWEMYNRQAENSPALLVLGTLCVEYTAVLPLLCNGNKLGFWGNKDGIKKNSLRKFFSAESLEQLISKSLPWSKYFCTNVISGRIRRQQFLSSLYIVLRKLSVL